MRALLLTLPMVLSAHGDDHFVPEPYRSVAAYSGVPPKILYAMALQESGRHRQGEWAPWPWTLNISGCSVYYDSRHAMFEALMAALGDGLMRIDIGPLQVNWHWQFQKLGSPWLSTDPIYNTKIGSQILWNHYQQTGDWWQAVGKYHRAADDPQHRLAAQAYSDRVKRRWQQL
jgi:hypothetical protein